MTVTEFTRMDNGGVMYKLVDATRRGYLTDPDSAMLLNGVDKNVARVRYGNYTLVSFHVTGKNKMTLYIRDKIQE